MMDDSAGEGCSFLALPCSDIPAPAECDLWAQDCPDCEKCVPWAKDGGSSWNAVKCAPIDPSPKKPGESCVAPEGGVAGVDDCELGAMCWDVDAETNEGTCIGLCDGTPEEPTCAEPATSCVITNDAVLTLCLPMCDPLLQDCPDGQVCFSHSDAFICVIDASGEAGAYGDPCEYANACDPGLMCVEPEHVPDCMTGGCCTPFCDTTMPNACPGDGQECIPWFEEGMAPEGYENIGVCGVPQ